MKNSDYKIIEQYMLQCMNGSAHDKEHVYRVLYMALDIAKHEENVDRDILITACLLHDIGRKEQFENPKLCHEIVGSNKAFTYLIESGYTEASAEHIKDCILTHRFRSDNKPKSIEAKILFDADKLDVAGTLGIARTLFYHAKLSEPLYSKDAYGNIQDGTNDTAPSFFHEYKFKLEKIYDRFFTNRGREIAKERQLSAVSFYNNMLKEVKSCYSTGINELSDILN